MAKYGVKSFENNQVVKYAINAEDTYGTLSFTGAEIQEKFIYVDEEGQIFDEQNEAGTLKAQNTNEAEQKYLLAYSSKLQDIMDIKVPLDFDESKLKVRQKIKLIGASVTIGSSRKEVKVQTRNGENTQRVPQKLFYTQVEKVEIVGNEQPQAQHKPQAQPQGQPQK